MDESGIEASYLSEQFDVIVVGAGGSGLAAAYSAAQAGGKVLIVEKQPQPGGTTGIAIGSFTAAETSFQRRQQISDSVDDHVEDAGRFAAPEIEARNNAELRRFFLRETATTLQWLSELGLSFVGPSPEPPNRVPRMHNVVPGAKAYIAAFQIALQRLGVGMICDAEVSSLIRDKNRVVGVCCQTPAGQREFTARRGVILAGGDYANNPDMIARYKGDDFRVIEGINPHATGEGHQLALDAGAAMLNMDVTYGPELRFVPSRRDPFQQWLPASGWPARWAGFLAAHAPKWLMRRMIKRLLVTWQHPENSLFDDGAILINRDGQRFVDETKWPDREIAVAKQPGKVAFILLDERLARRYSAWPHFISTAPDIAYAYVADYLRLRPDVATTAADLAGVLRRRAIDVATAENTIADFNQHVAAATADAFGRCTAGQQLCGDRWVLLGPVKAYFTTTEGGAAINQQLQVLDEQGQIIPGLYAVGQNGLGGMILWGHGLHIAWALTSGRLAGRNIMRETPD